MKHSELLDMIRTAARYSYSRSAGPGGQNVNKVNTRVTVRLPLASLSSLGPRLLERIGHRLAGRINAERELLVHVQDERSQARNRELAEERLIELVLSALVEQKRRKPTRPSQAARRERVEAKKRRSRTKRNRQTRGFDQD